MINVRKNRFLKTFVVILAFTLFAALFAMSALWDGDAYAYAQDIENAITKSGITEKVPIEAVELRSNKEGEVKAKDVINLNVVTTPNYAIETVQNIKYLIVSGGTNIILRGSTITVKDDAIKGDSFSVCALIDGQYSNTLTWMITAIEIEEINILNEETIIQQNRTLQLNMDILPVDSTNKRLLYKITSGNEYARINQNGLITINNNLPRGDLEITVRAESLADSSVYAEKTYSLYVPTRSLYVTANNLNPAAGESVTLYEQIDANASIGIPNYTILHGEEYIQSREGNILKLADEINDEEPYILLEYTRDGLTRQLRLDVYIRTTGISFVEPIASIKQGGMSQFEVVTTPLNATRKNLTFTLSDDVNATISKEGLFAASVLPEIEEATVDVTADIDGISCSTTVIIKRPNVVLTANNYNPTTKSTYSQTVTLTTKVDNVITMDDIDYIITAGANYIEDGVIASNGTFTVLKGIADFDPEIKVAVTCGSWQSNEIIIKPHILVEGIRVKNSAIVNVEQQCSYNFSGTQYPINARNVNESLLYLIKDDSDAIISPDIATISNDGILEVKPDAPIGTVINVKITGADGIVETHTVSVVTVYATKICIEKVTNQNNEELLSGVIVNPGDVLTFDAGFPEPYNPFNVTEKEYYVTKLEGFDVATFDGHTATIKPQSQITDNNPYAVFKVVSIQGDEILEDYFRVQIHIAVTHIEYTQHTTSVEEGAEKTLSSLVMAVAKPNNASDKVITYTVDGHAVLLTKEDGSSYVQVEDEVSSGDLTFTITMQAEDQTITLTYGIYVATKDISISADKIQPITRLSGGENVNITIQKDKKASSELIFKILRGASLINGDYTDNQTIQLSFDADGNAIFNFAVKPSNYIGDDKLIEFAIEQGELTKSIQLEVYKPIESIALIINEVAKTTADVIGVDRDSSLTFTLDGLNAVSEPDAYTVTKGNNGGNIILNTTNKTNPSISIPATAKAGDRFTIIITATDRGKNSFGFTFEVNPLDEKLFKASYGKDNNGVVLSSEPQLWVGRYTDIPISYNGSIPLSKYGLGITPVKIEDPYGTFTKISYNAARLTIDENASGKVAFVPQIQIVDGNERYTISLKEFHVFRPMSGTPRLTNGTITSTPTQLKLGTGSFDTKATYGLDAFVFYGSSLNGVTLTNSGVLTVTTKDVTSSQKILLKTQKRNNDGSYSCTQLYNGQDVFFETSVAQSIHRISLSKSGGSSGDSSIAAVNGFCNTISTPSRTGYYFAGYYTAPNGGGTQYYDADGKLKVTHSNYSSISNLYAKWTPIKYKYSIGCWVINAGSNSVNAKEIIGTYEVDYDQEFTVDLNYSWLPSMEEHDKFVYWEYYDSNNQRLTSTSRSLTLKNMRTKPGNTVEIYACFEEPPKSGGCFATGTLITLADGTFKPVEDFDGTEQLLVWNFYTGTFDTAPILFIDYHGIKEYEVIRLYFDNGNYVEVIDNHGFFDITLQKYMFIDAGNAEEFVGHTFATQKGNSKLVSVEIEQKETGCYSPVTAGHLCYYVNGFLSMPANTEPFINIFDIDTDQMCVDEASYLADIEQYGLYTYETFISDWSDYLNENGQEIDIDQLQAMLPEIMYEAFCGQFLKISIGKGNTSWEEVTTLINMYSTQLMGGNE